MDYLTSIIIMAVLVMFSAYFSATETAFSSLNRARLKAESERGDKRSAEVLKLANDFDRLLSTLLIGNNIVNIAASSIGTVMFIQLLDDPDKGASVSTIVVTVVVLIFGEITPKSIAKEAPEGFARRMTAQLYEFFHLLDKGWATLESIQTAPAEQPVFEVELKTKETWADHKTACFMVSRILKR